MARAQLWPWAVPVVLLAALLAATVAADRSGWPSLVGDEASYLMAAESLAWDGDLRFTRGDFERFSRHWGRPPEGVILQSGDGGATLVYSKPWLYPALIAPFVRLAPVRGAPLANVLLLALAVWFSARALEPRLGRQAPLWVALFVFGSASFGYAFWAHADLALLAASATGLALVFGGRELQPPESGRGAALVRAGLAGVLLGAVVFSRPFYAPLFIPAALAAARAGGRRRLAALGTGILLLLVLAAGVHRATGGSWTPYGGERRAFYSYTGFPEVDFPAAQWPQLVAESGSAAWAETRRLSELPPVEPRLWGWNGVFLLAGRNVGLLPYFLPLFVVFLGRPQGVERWALPAAAALAVTGFLLYRPFNFYGGDAAIANRYFLPLYPAFWFMATRPIRLRWALAAALVAAPFLWPLWTSPGTFPKKPGGGYAHVSRVAERLLPFETTQSHLRPSGRKDLLHNGLWMRFLDPELDAATDWKTLYLEPGRRVELVVGSHRELTRLELGFPRVQPAIEVGGAGTLAPDGRIELAPGRRHPTWWSWEPVRLYVLELRFVTESGEPVPFTLEAVR